MSDLGSSFLLVYCKGFTISFLVAFQASGKAISQVHSYDQWFLGHCEHPLSSASEGLSNFWACLKKGNWTVLKSQGNSNWGESRRVSHSSISSLNKRVQEVFFLTQTLDSEYLHTKLSLFYTNHTWIPNKLKMDSRNSCSAFEVSQDCPSGFQLSSP